MSDGSRGASTATPAISLDSVDKHYGPTVALEDLTMTVSRGEFVAVTGPSGSGKSTLLSLIASIEAPDEGAITVDGHPVAPHGRHLSRYRRNTIGLVFQLHNLLPRLTARENIEVATMGNHQSHRDNQKRVEELIDRLNLAHRADAKPATMSGGERQRVAFGRALVNRPAVILADEPTGSLDDASAEVVLDLLAEGLSDGTAVLAVSHDRRLDARSSRLVHLVDGRID